MPLPRLANPDPHTPVSDAKSRRDYFGPRWIEFMGTVGVFLTLTAVGLFPVIDSTGQLLLAMGWIVIATLVAGAWLCRPSVAIAISLVTLIVWSCVEVKSTNWTEWLPGHLVRLLVAMGLVIWLLRLREKLATALKLARVDSLTGLPNRQALIEAMEAELSRAKRFGRPFSLAMLDCDGFKQINDLKGHLAGDELLRRVSEALRQNTRPFDCAGRWGGDEFLIVLSEVDHDDAQMIAERLRATMRHDVERDHPSLTFSLGVVTVLNAPAEWQECLRRADEAMYTAKSLGPDQTRFEILSDVG